jgi:hypothetical protein
MCSFFYACHTGAVINTLITFGIVALCLGFAIAAIIRAWRAGSTDRNIDAMIRDARRRSHRRGYDDA